MSLARTVTTATVLLFAPLPALAQTKDHAPVDLPSSQLMSHDQAGTESWTYVKPGLELSKYRSVIVEPTVVYDGPDAQFDGIEREDRARFAQILTTAVGSELAGAFPPPAKAGPGTLRIRLTLLGAKKTKGGIATATRATTFGLATNAVMSAIGKPGTLTGSMLVAIEAFDEGNNELLVAAVRRRSPDALDIPATLSTTDTVKAIARDLADNIRKRLESGSSPRK
ncbi:MAG TPA: DUF3313 domain-containing protein [Nitrospiraceae bacterium]|nr:DUF3313 domain-containing protein [Nitrospiraceae bacterium]